MGTDKHSVQEARALVGDVMKELYGVKTRSGNDPKAIAQAFAAAAEKVSEHPSASAGGDLGWVDAQHAGPKIADAVFAMKPGTFSGILETDAGDVPRADRGASGGGDGVVRSRAARHPRVPAQHERAEGHGSGEPHHERAARVEQSDAVPGERASNAERWRNASAPNRHQGIDDESLGRCLCRLR